MATFGEIRERVVKSCPGVDSILLNGYLNGRYLEVLDRLSWERLEVESVLQTVAPYETGTLSVTNAATSLTGSGTTWTAAMSGRQIRIAGRNEYYEFTRTGATTGTIDRAYEGDTDTAATFKIFQFQYPLAADVRLIEDMRIFDLPYPMDRKTRGELNSIDPARVTFAQPQAWASYMDDLSDPPRVQIELWPVPDDVYSIPIRYVAEKTVFGQTDSSVTVIPWLRPAVLEAGAKADYYADIKDFSSSEWWEGRFEKLVAQMKNIEAERAGPATMVLPGRHVHHRVKRWGRNVEDF